MQYTFRDDSQKATAPASSGRFFAASAARGPVLDRVSAAFSGQSTAARAVQGVVTNVARRFGNV